MKVLIIILSLCFSTSFADVVAPTPAAPGFDLKNKAILGEYDLVTPDPTSDIQSVEIRYDKNLQATLVVKGQEYPLNTPSKDQVVFDQELPPGCTPGPCTYTSHVLAYLQSTKSLGGTTDIPQISLELTTSTQIGRASCRERV